MLYKDICSSVSDQSDVTPGFPIMRGKHQSCPVSPFLIILATEPRANSVKNCADLVGISVLEGEFMISQFADDTTIFLN